MIDDYEVFHGAVAFPIEDFTLGLLSLLRNNWPFMIVIIRMTPPSEGDLRKVLMLIFY